jgi:hypothetical protein
MGTGDAHEASALRAQFRIADAKLEKQQFRRENKLLSSLKCITLGAKKQFKKTRCYNNTISK